MRTDSLQSRKVCQCIKSLRVRAPDDESSQVPEHLKTVSSQSFEVEDEERDRLREEGSKDVQIEGVNAG
jgi:hypothetical protein